MDKPQNSRPARRVNLKTRRPLANSCLLIAVLSSLPCWPAFSRAAEEMRIAVLDPLSNRLACGCVADYARRDYDALATHLERQLDRRITILYGESANRLLSDAPPVDVLIGKSSVVRFDAARAGKNLRTLAVLSGKDGSISQTGLFVVRSDDPAEYIGDLDSRSILFGTSDSDETHSAAFAALEAFAIPRPAPIATRESCSAASLAVVEGDADAAVVSSYALPLLRGCGTIDAGELKVIGQTDAVPFITVFGTEHLTSQEERSLLDALRSVRDAPEMLAALESRDGFVPLPELGQESWRDWRGNNRQALSDDVPDSLPTCKRLLWSRTLTGPGMAGVAVADGCVIVADKDLDETVDIFRCLDSDTGNQRWQISYPAAGDMDFTNSPRATPVIHDGRVYLLGAFGDLHCVQLRSGRILWKRHLAKDFDATRPQWGYSSTPLIVDDKLIVNPGAAEASLVALDRGNGEVVWKSAGGLPGYASFIRATIGNQDQIIGYDIASLGGWDPVDGRRLWTLAPEIDGDFNVPTPIVDRNRLIVATENNGTRILGFDKNGLIVPQPLAQNEDLAPDTSTPLLLDEAVYGAFGSLTCLDAERDLQTCWDSRQDGLIDYCSLIGGNGRLLVMSQGGELLLIKADKDRFQCLGTLRLFDDLADTDREVWSHPALVGNRLYVRNLLGIYCFLLD